MEYLEGFTNLKTELIEGKKNDHVSKVIGEYLAIKSFKTSRKPPLAAVAMAGT